MRLDDLTGKRFGMLTVIERDYARTGGVYWTCICDCGNTKSVASNHLKHGRTKSCGCLSRKYDEDITGQKFGRLTAIRRDDSHSNKWVCECECGNVVSVYKYHLHDGHTQSCGCKYFGCRVKDRAGEKYGLLTVIERAEDAETDYHTKWLCKCECGNEVIVSGSHLTTGHTKTCGDVSHISGENSPFYIHGSEERLYNIWAGIKSRCYYDKNKSYRDYGGRGITMCDEWKNNYLEFRRWALEDSNYAEHLTIDRIDVNGNYEPSNCRWATIKEQNNNRRNSLKIALNGEEKTVSEWCDFFGLNQSAVRARLKRGWSAAMAFELA